MKNAKKYYKKTEKLGPSTNIKKFLEIEQNTGKAIELGCGAGKDTIHLIKNGWEVLAIDKEDVKERISKKLNKEETKKFKFSKQEFENIKLEKSNLIVANFSLPFCSKNKFNELWEKIENNILTNGYFIGTFFGIKDEWKNSKKDIIFLTKEETKALFQKFEIIIFKEIEKDGKTALGNQKHWHIYSIIAKKK